MVTVVAVVGAALVVLGLSQTAAPPDPATDPAANELRVATGDLGQRNHLQRHRRPRSAGRHSSRRRSTRNPQRRRGSSRPETCRLRGSGRRRETGRGLCQPGSRGRRAARDPPRLPDGSTTRCRSLEPPPRGGVRGQSLRQVRADRLECADLSGDGTPEISSSLVRARTTLAAVRVFTADGARCCGCFTRGRSPMFGRATGTGTGRAELYVGRHQQLP